MNLRRAALLAAACALPLLVPARAPAQETPIPTPPGAGDDLRRTAVVRAVEAVSPAVVSITTDHVIEREGYASFGDMWNDRRRHWQDKWQSLGSGFVVDPEGFVLTNTHVVKGGTTIRVKFRPADGIEDPAAEGLEARVIASAPRADLSLLKIQAKGPFPMVPMGSSHDLLIGEPAIAIGNPFGFESTVTAGVISAVNRTLQMTAGPMEGLIQTDASIDPGNSGGPLLNIHGRLVGVNTFVASGARNIGFAIPVDRVKSVLGSLLDPVRSSQLSPGFEVMNEGRALVVDTVVPAGPAERAGLRAGDAILGCEGGAPCSVYSFKAAVLRRGAGEKIALRVRRPGVEKPLEIAVPLEEHPGLRRLRERLGVDVEPRLVTGEDGAAAVRFHVTAVRHGSAAARIDVQPADVVGALAGLPVENADEVDGLLRDIPREQLVPIRVYRQTPAGWRFEDTELSLD